SQKRSSERWASAIVFATPGHFYVIAGHQLVDGWERAQHICQINEFPFVAVGEIANCVDRAPVGRAESDQSAAVLPSVKLLKVVPRNQPAHAVREEDHLRIFPVAEGTPFAQSLVHHQLERGS